MNVRPTVLLVDDDPNDVKLLRLAFTATRSSFDITALSHGEEAIQYLSRAHPYEDRNQFPDPVLMLLDLRMPMIDGFEVLTWMREQPPGTMPPVIVLSHSRLMSDRDLALDLGALDAWQKPVDFHKTLAFVRYLERFNPQPSVPSQWVSADCG